MKPVIVGIAGGTASGKTTTAREVAAILGQRCLWLTHDRYYLPLPPELQDDPVRHNFDHPAALETSRLVRDLAELRAGRAASVPVYDFSRHQRADEEEVLEPREVILVEGILVLAHRELRALMDHRVYVHAPDDVRLVRRIRRDMVERGREVEEILAQYERTVRPMHEQYVAPSRAHADLVVDGTTTTRSMVASVLGLLGLRAPDAA